MFHHYRLLVLASVAPTLGVDIYVCVCYTRESQDGAQFSVIAAGGG